MYRQHEALAGLVQQIGSLTAHSLADEKRLGTVLDVERCRMELDEFHVDDTATCLVSHGDTVSDGGLRICSPRIDSGCTA